MIEEYWQDMFGDYQVGPSQYEIPGFPELLMSPHFGSTNIIGTTVEGARANYLLCYFDPIKESLPIKIEIEELAMAIQKASFWEFQKVNYNESLEFMQRLLPFLVKTEKDYFHFYLKKENVIIASAIVGVGKRIIFTFNALVKKECRQQGLAEELIMGIRSYFPHKFFFYWTKHSWFLNSADKVMPYSLI